MYVIAPGGFVDALDATNGDLIWEYKRDFKIPRRARVETDEGARDLRGHGLLHRARRLSSSALDARTGEVRWETYKTEHAEHFRRARRGRQGDLGRHLRQRTRQLLHRGGRRGDGRGVLEVLHRRASGRAGLRVVGRARDNSKSMASTWGLPGTYDPVRKMLYWGVANPMPDQRMARHDGNPDGISRIAPADLYSNSHARARSRRPASSTGITSICRATIGTRTTRTSARWSHVPFDPDPKFVKWINPDIPRGSEHDIAVMVGEGGGVFVLDRSNGQFLWAMPFPYDDPNFVISDIDVKTGQDDDQLGPRVQDSPGEHHIICYWNTRSYWPTAYDPKQRNSLYVPYIDNCRDMTLNGPGVTTADGK